MTKSKFEQLIEFVINDEEQKARELFHDIVVEKSRTIYENLMNEEDEVEKDDKAEKAGKKVAKDIEYDEKEDKEDCNEDVEDMNDDVETDEQGMNEEDEESEEEAEDDADAEFDDEAEKAGEEETDEIEDMGDEEAAGGDMEDRVVDLEDKLDELMAEFESLMGDDAAGDDMAADGEEMIAVDDEVGGDAYAQDDTEEFQDVPMAEGISLKAVAKPTHGDDGSNAKSPVAANSGARGAMAQPVKNTTTESNPDGTSSYKQPSNAYSKGESNVPGAGNFKNVPGKDGSKQSPAPKPTTAQAAGVNSRTPFPKV